MKKLTSRKSLSLTTQTIRRISSEGLAGVDGGSGSVSSGTQTLGLSCGARGTLPGTDSSTTQPVSTSIRTISGH